MQMPQQSVDFAKYLHLLWRKKWFVLPTMLVLPVAVGLWTMRLSDQYQSTTLILVQAQRVPTQFVPSTVTTGIEERLQTINQQILSRTRLEEIIREFGLFAREKKRLSPEEVIELMRSRIQLKVHRTDAFQLSYVDGNARQAMLVTNKLASLFIEENLKVREQQAIGTSQFLEAEIQRVKEQVREKEKLISDFKQKHISEMNEQLTSNQSRLGQLQSQLQINAQQLSSAEDRKLKLQQSLAEVEKQVQQEYESRRAGGGSRQKSISEQLVEQFMAGSGEGSDAIPGLEAEIDKRERELERLKLTYTERHPEVLRVQAELRKLRQRLETEQAKLEKKKAEAPKLAPAVASDPSPVRRYPPQYGMLKAELSRVDAEIARMAASNREIQRAVELYQGRIAAAPVRQLELTQISDDYTNLKTTMDNLVDKKLQAELSENLEKKQKGEQFQILDPANLPEKPFSPDRLRYVGGAFVAGGALGVGIVLLLEVLTASLRTRQEIVDFLEVPVLAVVPEIVTLDDVARRRRLRMVGSAVAAAALLLIVCVVHFAVAPLPTALKDFYHQARDTHWTTM